MPTTRPLATDPAQVRAVELLRRSQRFVLCGHVRPDGDCIGAQAALASVLKSLGKDVWIINPDPVDGQFEYLARDVRYAAYTGGDLPPHDVACMLDFCELHRTGAMEDALRRAGSKTLVIDHHVGPAQPWWDEAYVDVRASATGVLVYRIARELGVPIDPLLARGVFTSLVTDTGWFKYSNTDAETLRVAGELCERGVKPSEIYAAIYQRRSARHPPYVARLLSSLETFEGDRLAVVHLPLAANETDGVDADEVLDILRSVRDVEVVLYLREIEGGKVKLSARSKTTFDVHKLAGLFGGGGHVKASGATIQGSLDDVRARVVAAAREQLGASAAR